MKQDKLKNITNYWPSASNLQNFFLTHFSWPHYPGKIQITLEQIFLTVGQNNYGNKIPFLFQILNPRTTTEYCLIPGPFILCISRDGGTTHDKPFT